MKTGRLSMGSPAGQRPSRARPPAPARARLKLVHAEATQDVILGAAVERLRHIGAGDLTVRDVARHAGIAERTVFRYYPEREAFLDAVAQRVRVELRIPPPPADIAEVLAYAARLFAGFEAQAALTRAALHTELFKRFTEGHARERWLSVQRAVDAYAPRAPARLRRQIAANIRYLLSASTWNYYRTMFGFSPDETVDAVTLAIHQAVEALKR